MKANVTLIVALVLGVCFTASATSVFGVKGGLNVSQLMGDDSDLDNTTTDPRIGFNAGVFLEIALFELFSIQPEVIYTLKGETIKAGGVFGGGTWNVELEYMEIPILAKIYLPFSLISRPFLYAGPFIGFNVSATSDNIYEVGPFNFDADANLDEDVRALESGIALGAGVRKSAGPLALILDARYTFSMTPAFDDSAFDKVYNGVFMVLVGIGLQL
jgi:hypothetical protein